MSIDAVSGPAEAGATYTVKPHKSYEPTAHWQVAEAEAPVRQLHTSEMPVISGVSPERMTAVAPGALRVEGQPLRSSIARCCTREASGCV